MTTERVCLLLTSRLGCVLSLWPVGASLGRLVMGATARFLHGVVTALLLSSALQSRLWSLAHKQGEGVVSLWGRFVFSAHFFVSSVIY